MNNLHIISQEKVILKCNHLAHEWTFNGSSDESETIM